MFNKFPVYEDVWEIGGTAPHILNLRTSLRWVVNCTTQSLYRVWNSPW